jgi:dipeptide/tripeptide permease
MKDYAITFGIVVLGTVAGLVIYFTVKEKMAEKKAKKEALAHQTAEKK